MRRRDEHNNEPDYRPAISECHFRIAVSAVGIPHVLI
jgi:hypothetical protein